MARGATLDADGTTYLFSYSYFGPCDVHEGCSLVTCDKCSIHAEVMWDADSTTHHVADRSGTPFLPTNPPHRRGVALCARCWGALLREDD